MFFLATIADTIQIDPQNYSDGDEIALRHAIHKKYPEMIIMDVGLVISLYDVIKVGSALIHAADGK